MVSDVNLYPVLRIFEKVGTEEKTYLIVIIRWILLEHKGLCKDEIYHLKQVYIIIIIAFWGLKSSLFK